MLSEARTITIECAKNYEYRFNFLQIIEDYAGDDFLSHDTYHSHILSAELTCGRTLVETNRNVNN